MEEVNNLVTLLGSVLATLSLFMLWYVYDGYGRLLSLLAVRQPSESKSGHDEDNWPTVSVILPVYNEEKQVGKKLDNILAQDYQGSLEILVVSDGSTDRTDEIVQQYADKGVVLIRTPGRLGKSLAQNMAVEQASGEILILTDAAVEMATGCIKALVMEFLDRSVGCVTGGLQFRAVGDSAVSQDQGYYWRYELKLRELESRLGWLAVTAGPLMAVRRELWVPLQRWYGDDCVIPLDVILQGFVVRHVADAVAWDESFSTFRQEFRARIRMTIRNWQGTFARGELLNPILRPQLAFALYSHKILRWLSPVWLLGMVTGLTMLWMTGVIPNQVIIAMSIATVLVLGAVLLVLWSGRRVPVISTLASFLVVNVAFGIGVLRAIRGRSVGIYQNK